MVPKVVVKMEIMLVFCVFISLGVSAPILEDAQAKILHYENENDGQGSDEFSFQTSNGIERKESGRLVNAGLLDEHFKLQGFYTYTDPEGKLVTVPYIENENGHRIKGSLPMIKKTVSNDLGALHPSVIAGILGLYKKEY